MTGQPDKKKPGDEPKLTPENITPEQRRIRLAEIIAKLEAFYAYLIPEMLADIEQAAADQDNEELKRIAARIGDYQSKQDELNDAFGPARVSPLLVRYVKRMGIMRDFIHAAVRGELPGSCEGDEWKTGET